MVNPGPVLTKEGNVGDDSNRSCSDLTRKRGPTETAAVGCGSGF